MTSKAIYAYAIALAYCSLAYEFILIRLATIIQGGQIANYNLTVSLFTFFLGLGSLTFDYKKTKDYKKELTFVELLLSFVGLSAPLIGLYTQSFTVILFFICLIGFLSGFELPLLFKLTKESESNILAWDYLGMFFAALTVPLLMIPTVGIGVSVFLISGINILLAIGLIKRKLFLRRAITISLIVMAVVAVNFHFQINDFLSNLYLNAVI